ncbi:MAG: aminopeptidase N [Bdellovibrionales bacterium RIFCSPHIGHO2_01_FULL_40_29]|nr:MAG: aminopeptidase N [Bdellovibrionales bacterium RIFCSPHIGHO2_01_FULL_40_29]OFZ32708.1 MAG: aminopeptidase N [Bdellovibrionales bacterium RIFCSPHIGHO2_02_FULL_40_15]
MTKVFLKDYTAPDYTIESLNLHFNLHETKTVVTSVLAIKKLNAAPLVFNGEHLKLLSVRLDGQDFTAFTATEETLTISDKNLPETFELKIQVEINPEQNKACEGLYLSNGIFCTQCEAESFRKITYMMDRPDVMTTYTVQIEADKKKYPLLLSNGDCVATADLTDGRHTATWKDPFKKPSYLFALVAGDMGVIEDHFITASGKKVKLEVFAAHGKENRCLHAMASLKKAMKWDEDRFGLEYDLNQYMIVAIDDFNMGAMENKGLNVFNSKLVLADTESATDDDFDAIESVVGHEYFHNWTGNRVTCRNWFELSLKEGLTVFRDQEFSADMNSRPVQRIKDVSSLRARQFPEDAGPNAHPVRPSSCMAVDNFYTATIYEKGSEVIRMMQTIVGKKGFRSGMNEYFKRHDGQAVTIDQFAAAISEANGMDFSQFKLWYSQAGTPEVSVTEKYDNTTQKYTLTLQQNCPLTWTEQKENFDKKPFHIPLLVGLIDSNGAELSLNSKDIIWNSDKQPVLHLKESQQTFTFEGLASKPTLSLNRQFSAPIRLKWEASIKELTHLIKFDSDAFNKFEFSQKIVLLELKNLIKKLNSGITDPEVNLDIIHSIGSVLQDPKLDSAFKSLMLSLPSDSTLVMEEPILDAKIFEAARNLIRQTFVKHYGVVIQELYKKLQTSTIAADRSLKNRLLAYLFRTQFNEAAQLTAVQYEKATSMTDRIAALSLLSETVTADRDKYLKHFFDLWSKDLVVFSKWLGVQASSPAQDTFQKMKEISNSDYFNSQNPNSIYAFHSLFGKNYLAFNTDDGETYNWFCDEILKIDSWNPQVAARLCTSFNFVKKLPPLQQEKAILQIKRILANTKLSKNSRELLEKCI